MARTRRGSLVVLVGSACVAAATGAVVLAKAAPSTTLVSVNASGTGGATRDSLYPAMSPNGRFVTFSSSAGDLVPDDTHGLGDVFVRDLKRGTTTLVSVNAAGTGGGNMSSDSGPMSANGRYLAFTSSASDLVPGDVNGRADVFLRDLRSGTTRLVSVNAAGTGGGNDDSSVASISANGRYVAFESDASDLVPGDANGQRDVFVRDVRRGTTTLVSSDAAGTGSGNSASVFPRISANGRFVAFTSVASDLVPGDGNGLADAFVRDLGKSTTVLISVNAAGTGGGNDESYSGAISANGRLAAISSLASDLVPGDVNGRADVFLRDLRRGTTTLVSPNASGTGGGDGHSEARAISANGRVVAFMSYASDLVPGDANGRRDVFVRDTRTGRTTLVSVNAAGTGGGNDESGHPSMDSRGRLVAFMSYASDLVPGDANNQFDVFLRRLR